MLRRFSMSTWAVLVLLGVSALSVTQQLREASLNAKGREAFGAEPTLSLPVAFTRQSIRIVDAIRSTSSDDRGESDPVHRVLAALGDENLAVYPFQFWTFLPVLLLPLTGTWIGLGVSLVVLGIKVATGRFYRRSECSSIDPPTLDALDTGCARGIVVLSVQSCSRSLAFSC